MSRWSRGRVWKVRRHLAGGGFHNVWTTCCFIFVPAPLRLPLRSSSFCPSLPSFLSLTTLPLSLALPPASPYLSSPPLVLLYFSTCPCVFLSLHLCSYPPPGAPSCSPSCVPLSHPPLESLQLHPGLGRLVITTSLARAPFQHCLSPLLHTYANVR